MSKLSVPTPISEQSNVYLCSSSSLKLEAVQSCLSKIIINPKITTIEIEVNTPEQPVNEGTARACFSRIKAGVEKLLKDGVKLRSIDKVISIENGVYFEFQKEVPKTSTCYDVCVLMVCSFNDLGEPIDVARYNSFGVKVDNGLFDIYLDVYLDIIKSPSKVTTLIGQPIPFGKSLTVSDTVSDTKTDSKTDFDSSTDLYNKVVFGKTGDVEGYGSTFGQFLAKLFSIQHNNWMVDPRFGNTDRRVQIKDALDKYMIDSNTDVIPDYPKPGVMFKHMTSVTVKPNLLNTMYEALERLISNNFDLNKIDYFAGLDARGFYLAPVLARMFKKGFIPVRKANKVPVAKGQVIARESYGTEYSTDEFGLEFRDEYLCENPSQKKNVLILDDLLATSGSILGALKVLQKVGLNVVGAVTMYDVPALRSVARTKLGTAGLMYKVVINNDNTPDDFMKLAYQIPDIMYKRVKYMLEEAKTPITERKYTLTPEQWNEFGTSDDLTIEEIKEIDAKKMRNVRMIYTEKDKSLANRVLEVLSAQTNTELPKLNKTLRANITNEQFSNGETRIKIDANIRGKHIIVVCQIRTGHINDDLIELLLIMDACARASAEKITVIMPYYPYSRSDKKDDPRCPIGAAVVSKLLDNSNVNNLVSVDLHAGQIQGYLDKGFHNLYMKRYMCEYIYNNYLRFTPKERWNDEFVLIAPDAGSAKSVKGYSSILGVNNIILDKQRNYAVPGTVMASRMIGSVDDIKGKTGLIIDDMADTMGTMCAAAKELVEKGLRDVVVFVTHGILSGEAIARINTTPYIKEVIVSDTLPQEDNVARCPKLRVVSCDELIARTIDGILTGRSVSRLF
ncbi:phosphoribosylpyrophosphate synthetase [Yasminevirus sp. GU-2018]|uniref:ribose-phosphate diphosphokinase n=1 Tax=Yasminevirus sp. GU-2018 TaxID=2420051 RepID=A0A5K0UBE3_9VIRU|nr:phosphoribosylpyrophosphate synthetase [Yasminevirus sp. GU-2018]